MATSDYLRWPKPRTFSWPWTGFVVLASIEEAGELFISVETTADLVGCGSCGVRAVGHGRSVVQVRDLSSGGRPVRLVWRKRRWLCRDPDCETKSFTETSDLVLDSLTFRASFVGPDWSSRWRII